ncbi:hypothetical protein Clacol_009043 [Clathrus columnatus]|uniref:Xylanolytic transcriptional activator regulatory domain-containing protein n=1 Tax=Clathrus columnatus TaxID=1419009 RepID=A0AAV5AK56_9AGAM|nr:hypothetical protein Clacol_009043 [Clathrus columnatus]
MAEEPSQRPTIFEALNLAEKLRRFHSSEFAVVTDSSGWSMEAPSSIPPPSHTSSVSGSSRVTVVCAESVHNSNLCPIRRTPCSSCIKRDTVSRCTYSAAAAEKIDVQSLHNRILVLEAQISQLSSGKGRLSSDLDHALLAAGASGSSVLISLDDVAGLWLEHLDLGRDSGVDLHPALLSSFETTHPSSPKLSSLSDRIASPLAFIYQPVSNAVTPELLAFLPTASQRPALLDSLTSICRMHPSLNFPHFRARINLMFVDNSGPDEIGIGPSRTSSWEKPTLSFFAATAAGFALALQCSPNPTTLPASPRTTSSSNSPSPSTPQPTVSFLLSLSGHILQAIEDLNEPFDLDYLHAHILRCLCMLHDGHPRVNQSVFAAVGKMVNVARIMGLSRDPDEFPRKYTPWKAEMRRRVWWDIFYYDVFISDCLGFPPMISDDQHTCRLPADVDEEAFVPKSVSLPIPSEYLGASNFSYFLLKCKLAQLVKNMKKRGVGHDQPGTTTNDSNCGTTQEPLLEKVTQAETEIKQFLSDLPQSYQLDLEADPFHPTYTSSSSSLPPTSNIPPAYLIIQRCELVIIAHQLILKLFLPFLRRPGIKPSDNSMIASIDSAHSIIKAASIAKAVWQKQSTEGAADAFGLGFNNILSSHGVFYPFVRQLFDAAVVAAHVVIRSPQSIVSSVAMEDLRLALGVLRDPALVTSRGRPSQRGGVEGAPSEAISIIEMLLKKAEMARRNYAPVSAGTKRKHDEVDPNVSKGFWLPYVGGGVATDTRSSSSSVAHSQSQASPRNKPVDKAESRLSVTSVRSNTEKELKYPPPLRSKASSSSLNGAKMTSNTLHHHRRDSSHSSSLSIVPPPLPPLPLPHPPLPASETEMFVRPSTASGLPSSVGPESSVPRPATSYSHIYGIEERHSADSASTTTRFPSHPPPATDTHSYSQPFPPRPLSSAEPPSYNSTAYSREHDRSTPATPYYVAFQPPLSSNFSSMDDHSRSHSHQHEPVQASQHMMMDMIQGEQVMDTGEPPREAKADDHMQRRNSHSAVAPPFVESWATNPAISRFSHPPWDSGYSY